MHAGAMCHAPCTMRSLMIRPVPPHLATCGGHIREDEMAKLWQLCQLLPRLGRVTSTRHTGRGPAETSPIVTLKSEASRR